MKRRWMIVMLAFVILTMLAACGQSETDKQNGSQTEFLAGGTEKAEGDATDQQENTNTNTEQVQEVIIQDGFIHITGGTFQMGSPEDEAWRSDDETQHIVSVSDFFMSPYEVTQEEYEAVTGNNPSNFSGKDLPVENVSWLDAATFCNAYSKQNGFTPVYSIEGESVSWDRSADGYRLPTEAEWEFACRAGTTTPFYMENSPSAEEANYYGHYPYMIEGNYFSQENLSVKPGEYRQTTVAVGSFSPNPFGLYDMHGNVSEWTWDIYGDYLDGEQSDPVGVDFGTRRVYRGGGWNDFAKNMRCAYRAMMDQDKGSLNIAIRLVRNAVYGSGNVAGQIQQGGNEESGSHILIAYFSWGGNTRGIAEEIEEQTGADLFEITLVKPYSDDYNTVLDEVQRDQNEQARPELSSHVENMEDYDVIILGYPNWWASIPMPIASFLEEYEFEGKTIIPFCSHGGGRFGQSLTAIAKLAPESKMGEALSIHYSGDSTLEDDISEWLRTNGIEQ